MRPVLVLQHAAWERPGLVADSLSSVPLVTRYVAADVRPPLPSVDQLSGLVVMGGSQDADDDATWPGLAAERELLGEAVDADVPVLGICLGMQLLAMALGARLHRRHGTEIGFREIQVLSADPVLDPLGPRATVLHWHSDAVDLPVGATLLASSPRTPVQAFRAGSALGLQFHVEVGPALLAEWLGTREMTGGLHGDHLERLRADGDLHLPRLGACAAAGFAHFADAVRDRG